MLLFYRKNHQKYLHHNYPTDIIAFNYSNTGLETTPTIINTTVNISMNMVVREKTLIIKDNTLLTYFVITANTELIGYLRTVAKADYALLLSTPRTYEQVFSLIC